MLVPEIPPNAFELSKVYLRAAVEEILDKSVETQERITKGNPFMKWAYLYFFLHAVLAKPAIALVSTKERREVLAQYGIKGPALVTLLTSQFILDHLVPNGLIYGSDRLLQHYPDLPGVVKASAPFLMGRLEWAAITGFAFAGAFAALEYLSGTKERNVNDLVDIEQDSVFLTSDVASRVCRELGVTNLDIS